MTLIVEFHPDASLESINAWLDVHATTAVRLTTTANIYKIQTATAPEPDPLILSIEEDHSISSQLLGVVEVIPASTGMATTFEHDADWWKTACSNSIDFDATSTTFQKRGLKTNVYLVDSGVKISHPEFASATISRLFTFNDNDDDNAGHGTALASLIVGDSLGISNASLKAVKIFDPNTETMASDIVRALDAIMTDMTANPGSISVVNMSWSIPKNLYIESRIQELINAGAVVVAAAGNSGVAIEDVTPASMDAVFTVGAYTEDFKPADFSNYTSTISNTSGTTNSGALDCWAPGVNILAAMLDGSTAVVAGTSAAAAIMSACFAFNSDFVYSHDSFTAEYLEQFKTLTLFRADILDLNDAKYHDSINIIGTFFMNKPVGYDTGIYSVTRVAYGNVEMHGFLTFGSYVSRIELDGDLPDGIRLSNGWLVGQLTNPPVDKTETLTYTVTITTLDGTINSFPLTLHLAKADTPPNDIPVDITLLVCAGATCGSCANNCYSCGAKNGGCVCAAQNAC